MYTVYVYLNIKKKPPRTCCVFSTSTPKKLVFPEAVECRVDESTHDLCLVGQYPHVTRVKRFNRRPQSLGDDDLGCSRNVVHKWLGFPWVVI